LVNTFAVGMRHNNFHCDFRFKKRDLAGSQKNILSRTEKIRPARANYIQKRAKTGRPR
jgi:hypothetical protein